MKSDFTFPSNSRKNHFCPHHYFLNKDINDSFEGSFNFTKVCHNKKMCDSNLSKN